MELSSLVLRNLKEDAERFLTTNVTEAVVTVPAYFNEAQRRATKTAGELAGLKVQRIINEPTAAALTYGFHDREAEKYLIVLDLGGGTFDVTLMEAFEGSLEIVATAGENFLGGEEFTDRLTASVCNLLDMHIEQAELTNPLFVSRLNESCEQAKRQLYEREAVTVSIPDAEGNVSESAETVSITRDSFADLVKPLLDRIKAPISKVLRDGDRAAQSVDEVILVGGATRMKVLQDFVRKQLSCEPRCEINPDEVVALGAAVQAALIEDNAAVDDLVMTDVCPHSLGVEAVKEIGKTMREGYFVPILHRNTTVPVSREETLFTIYPNQNKVLIKVFQGESRRVEDNDCLGELQITDIPPGPAGTPIIVRFTYDINAILEVESFVEGSQQRFRAVIAQDHTLSEQEVRGALARMQAIKFYPRDDAKNRHLLLFAEKTVGEASPMTRSHLEEAIDAYEQALVAGDPEFFEATQSSLLQVLSSLGFPYEQ